MRKTSKTKPSRKRKVTKDLAARKTAGVKGGIVVDLGGDQAGPAGRRSGSHRDHHAGGRRLDETGEGGSHEGPGGGARRRSDLVGAEDAA